MAPSDCLEITLLTVKVAACATLALIPVGTTIGWLLARRNIPARPLVESLLLLPMILPPVAVGLVLLYVMAPRSPVGRLWQSLTGDQLVFSWPAAAIASFVVALPLFVKAAEQAFANVPRRLEQLAETMGQSPWRIFGRVTLPLAARGLSAGALIAFARCLGEFGATNLVAGMIPGQTETLALGIYSRINAGHDADAWLLAGVSFALALGALVAGQLMAKRA